MADDVCFVGLGRMGYPLALKLLNSGVSLRAWDTQETARQAWRAAGGVVCEAAELGNPEASVCILCLPTPDGVEALLQRWEKGGPNTCRLVVDMGTTPPSVSRGFASRFDRLGIRYLDAPVTGGSLGAEKGRLCVMVGGDTDAFKLAEPWLARLGGRVVHAGGSGSGSQLKAVVQFIYLSYNAAFALGARLGSEAGLPAESLWPVLLEGACAHPLINARLDALKDPESQSGFLVWRALKDLKGVEERDSADPVAMQWLTQLESVLHAAGAAEGMDVDIFDALAPKLRKTVT
ncbi:MAG: NAD(P)-dependent oxidoreductase [Pigmentiphaga sp.]|uniref:NAD(P)-dependent oxidoreductase n=1 Tax=Pigmentiphaga sp. TaxID=1977564 RepID=UPI0029B8EF68|nr:NAD(P)-dependent oxidoreductase [Pigmentiphaga sp.]MDX3906372.1 NAD(P)-dependent oxidoreductase [Pigmentiphaga sp.]